MEELLKKMNENCMCKRNWEIEDFVIEEGKLLFKRGRGCKFDHRSSEWSLCKSCRSLVKHFDPSLNYLELYDEIWGLKEDIRRLNEKLDRLLEDKE